MTQYKSKQPTFIDIVGQRFGRLVVLRYAGSHKRGYALWECLCDCGNVKTVIGSHLRTGSTRSCNCLRSEETVKRNTKHGKTNTIAYRTWGRIIQRCVNPNAPDAVNYSERGIKVCAEWRHDFQAFYDHVSQLPNFGKKNYSLDRINNDGNYAPGNVRWATPLIQRRNQRRIHLLTYQGETKLFDDWAKEFGINRTTLYTRITELQWSVERALTTPVRVSAHDDNTMIQGRLFR